MAKRIHDPGFVFQERFFAIEFSTLSELGFRNTICCSHASSHQFWNIFKKFWCFLLICIPLFGPPGYLALSIHFSILSNQWHPSKVVVVVHDSQHVPNMIGVITIGFLFWTVMKECMAKKVFHGSVLSTVGVKFHASTPISVCYQHPSTCPHMFIVDIPSTSSTDARHCLYKYCSTTKNDSQ